LYKKIDLGYFHYLVTIEYYRSNIEYLRYSIDFKKDGAKRHPLRLRRINLQSSIFNSGSSGLGGYQVSMLSMENITAGYVEEIDVLYDVSLEVIEGAITGIIGANGAGKSTILKTIFGFLHPREGKIIFEGKEIQGLQPYLLKQRGISYMLQEYSTFPQMSIQDNLLLGAWTFRNDKNLVNERLSEIYEFFPVLSERRAEKATYLSGGYLRMLSVGKEIMSKPKLLMIDEPSVGLAPKIVTEIYDLLIKIARQGTTILIVDQNIMKALEVSEYMYLLDMGQVKQGGPKKDFEEDIREIIKVSLMAKD
jgi:ABC-type branched-subunit amino acid transport system ATPase component